MLHHAERPESPQRILCMPFSTAMIPHGHIFPLHIPCAHLLHTYFVGIGIMIYVGTVHSHTITVQKILKIRYSSWQIWKKSTCEQFTCMKNEKNQQIANNKNDYPFPFALFFFSYFHASLLYYSCTQWRERERQKKKNIICHWIINQSKSVGKQRIFFFQCQWKRKPPNHPTKTDQPCMLVCHTCTNAEWPNQNSVWNPFVACSTLMYLTLFEGNSWKWKCIESIPIPFCSDCLLFYT